MRKNKNYLSRNFKKDRTNDKLTAEKRSSLMSKIKSRDTNLEKNFIDILKLSVKNKFYHNVTSIKGKPDIVFYKKKVCVFLDSDFWHGWQYPRWRHLLKDDFWRTKIEKNRLRDKKITRYLRKNGWFVVRVWEHQIKSTPKNTIEKIKTLLK